MYLYVYNIVNKLNMAGIVDAVLCRLNFDFHAVRLDIAAYINAVFSGL